METKKDKAEMGHVSRERLRGDASPFLYNRKVIAVFACSLRVASVTSKIIT